MGDVHAARLRWVPDALTMSRFPIVAGMLAASFAGNKALYVTLVLLAVVTDMFDGAIARATGISSRWGANFDSASDLAFYLAVAACTVVWAPDVIIPLLPVLLLFTAGYLTSLALSKRARGVIGFHNRFSRLAATLAVVYGLWITLFGGSIAMTLVLAAAALTDLGYRFYHISRKGAGRRTPPPLAGVHGIALPHRGSRRFRRRTP